MSDKVRLIKLMDNKIKSSSTLVDLSNPSKAFFDNLVSSKYTGINNGKPRTTVKVIPFSVLAAIEETKVSILDILILPKMNVRRYKVKS